MRKYPHAFYEPYLPLPHGVIRHGEKEIAWLTQLRDEVRAEEGGGGMCSPISEILDVDLGWTRFAGVYLSREGELICDGHLWNLLPDGTIVDTTVDQFGEFAEPRLIAPDDPEYLRYRPEFDEEFHPGSTNMDRDYPGASAHYADWCKEYDLAVADRLVEERGPYWWLEDKTLARAYLEQQEEFRLAYREEHGRFPIFCEHPFTDRLPEGAGEPVPA